MSLNDIQLSASQLVDLYGRNLILPSDGEEPIPAVRPVSAPSESSAASEPRTPNSEPRTTNSEPRTPDSRLPTPDSFQYLGKNQKKIAILVNSPKEVYLPESELSFLASILQACRLHLGDVAIVNHARHPLPPAALREQLESEYILVFGVPLGDPALSQQPSFIPLAQNGYSIMLAPALGQLNATGPESKLLKSKLWICLKQLFNV